MKRIQEKEKAISFLVDRIKKHLHEAFNKLDATEPAKDCVDISIRLVDRMAEEINSYTKLMANRMQHYANVASMLSEKMSKFSDEIKNLEDDEADDTNVE